MSKTKNMLNQYIPIWLTAGVYFSVAALICLFSFLQDKFTTAEVGLRFLTIGIAIAVVSVVSQNWSGGRGGGSAVWYSDTHFSRWWKDNRVSRYLMGAVIWAAVLLAITGIVLIWVF